MPRRPVTFAAGLAHARVAAAFLTRLPVASRGAGGLEALAAASAAFPVVGAAIGLLSGGTCAVALMLGLGPWLAAVLAVACQVLVTGALHEDGLADLADGLGGGGDREAKLAIMRDSRIGTFGVIALVLALAARIAAVAALAGAGAGLATAALVVAAAASRAAMAWPMRLLPPARSDGLAAAAGTPALGGLIAGSLIAAALALALIGAAGLAALAAAALGAFIVARLAERQIGGQTGDVLGAAQVAAEIACLIVIVLLVAP